MQKYVAHAWNSITQETIENCWLKADILPKIDENEIYMDDDAETTTEIPSNEEILKVVLPNDQEKEIEEQEPLDLLPPITHNEAINCCDKIILYLVQQESDFDIKKNELKFVKKLKKEALKQRFISARQINLDSFINGNKRDY